MTRLRGEPHSRIRKTQPVGDEMIFSKLPNQSKKFRDSFVLPKTNSQYASHFANFSTFEEK